MKKKLSILITSLAGGGAERVVSILLHELLESYDITLILMNDTIVYDIPSDIDIVYLENSNLNENAIIKILKLPILGFKYKQICKKKNIDTSLSFMYRPNFINIFAKLFGLKSKIIVSERNTPSKTYEGLKLSSRIGRMLIKYLYPYSDKILPNSKGNAEDLINNFNIKRKQIKVIENPFDLKKIDQLKNEIIRIKNQEKKFIYIIVGRLESHKRHSLVIEAFSELKFKPCELWIVGKGPLEEDLKNLVEKLQLKEKVKFIGFDSNPYKYISKADCFILASTREGFPNVLVEALSCGIPVISSDCYSGPREILNPNSDINFKLKDNIEISDYGILFPVENKDSLVKSMKIMLDDKKIYTIFKKNSNKRATDFNVKKIMNEFKSIL